MEVDKRHILRAYAKAVMVSRQGATRRAGCEQDRVDAIIRVIASSLGIVAYEPELALFRRHDGRWVTKHQLRGAFRKASAAGPVPKALVAVMTPDSLEHTLGRMGSLYAGGGKRPRRSRLRHREGGGPA